MSEQVGRTRGAWLACAHCEERHDPDYDCRTYVPVCEDCGRRGGRRFRQRAVGGSLRDVLAPSLTADAMECSACGSTEIQMAVIDA